MSKFRFDAIVFDFDGVLVESVDVKSRAFAALYAEYGPDIVAKVVEYHHLHGGISRFLKFHYYHKNLLGKPLSEVEGKRLGEKFSQLVVDEIVASPYVPGAIEFLMAHSSSTPLFVASGTPEEELTEIINRRGMSRFFRATYGTPATKAEILRRIAENFGWQSSRMVMIGDALSDLEGARKTGTAFIGRKCGDSHPFPPDVSVLPDLLGLSDLLATSA